MVPGLYYSDRHGLRGEPVSDVGGEFWEGFLRIFSHLKSEGLLIAEFGSWCNTGQARVEGILEERLALRMRVEVGLDWANEARRVPPASHVALDCVEFFARRVQMPKEYQWHDAPGLFAGHRDYGTEFDRNEGLQQYSEMVNGLFRVHNHPFQLVGEHVVRRGEPEFELLASHHALATGDADLDRIVEQSRSSFWSMNPDGRRLAVERGWDAFERLKTMMDLDKKRGVTALIERASDRPEIRSLFERECAELTRLGNNFQIRHHEKGKTPIENPVDFDYLFFRLYALITRLLPYVAARTK